MVRLVHHVPNYNFVKSLNAPEIKASVLPDEFLLSHSLQAFNPSGDLVDLDVIKNWMPSLMTSVSL